MWNTSEDKKLLIPKKGNIIIINFFTDLLFLLANFLEKTFQKIYPQKKQEVLYSNGLMNQGYETNDDDEGFNRGKFFNFLFFKKSVKIKVDQVVIPKVLDHWKDSVYYLFIYKYIFFKGGYGEKIESITSSTCEKELVYF